MANKLSSGVTDAYLFRTNPVIRKLSRVEETSASDACTYAGIMRKLLYFIGMVALGIIACMLVSPRLGGSVLYSSDGISVNQGEAVVVAITFLVFIISPLLAMIIKSTIPVTGALFCLSTGYIMTWAAMKFGKEYRSSILLAVILTLIVFSSLGFLYFTGKVRVTEKFRSILTTLILSALLMGVVVFILALIPATRPFVNSLQGNLIINIGGSVIWVIIASLFLLVDFDTVRRAVDDELPKKYEWWASFGLAFSVIWLFFKILELISKLKGSEKK